MREPAEDEGFEEPIPSLAEKVRFLSNPRHHPGQPSEVRVIETHMSYVFRGPKVVYKLKKPVHDTYFDFRDIDARRQNCATEVTLNRRLAPRTYLGLVALKEVGTTTLQLGGTGKVIEWLVKMRYLPTDRMLDKLIKSEQLTSRHLEQLGRLLVGFYRHATRIEISAGAYRHRYQICVDDWISSLRNPMYEQPVAQLERVRERLRDFIARGDVNGLDARSQRVVEAHGDLKPEHICFTQPPEIFDCLEFSRELRSLDPVEELAFLAIESERLKAHRVGEHLLPLYQRLMRDQVPERVILFYKAYRCLLRAHLAARHLLDENVKKPDRWLKQTRDYLDMADHYAEQLEY